MWRTVFCDFETETARERTACNARREREDERWSWMRVVTSVGFGWLSGGTSGPRRRGTDVPTIVIILCRHDHHEEDVRSAVRPPRDDHEEDVRVLQYIRVVDYTSTS